jgi:hypothetical protein
MYALEMNPETHVGLLLQQQYETFHEQSFPQFVLYKKIFFTNVPIFSWHFWGQPF